MMEKVAKRLGIMSKAAGLAMVARRASFVRDAIKAQVEHEKRLAHLEAKYPNIPEELREQAELAEGYRSMMPKSFQELEGLVLRIKDDTPNHSP